jgi:hypothetical protein
VKTKKITKYWEIVDEYAKEHPGEMTEFEEGEYDLVLEFYKFFNDNWKIIMENLGDFQEEYDKIKGEKEREKNSRQRKTRKMRKVRNSKSRKSRGS